MIIGLVLFIHLYAILKCKSIINNNLFIYLISLLLPPSPQMYPLIGLNLLRLLSQNRIAEFHTALENIDPEQLLENDYIKHPVHLEQYLMEGSYNKVWNSREKVPAPEYLFFIDILMETIRSAIIYLHLYILIPLLLTIIIIIYYL